MMRFVIAHEVGHALVFHIIWGRVAPMIRRVIETLRLPKKNGIAASLMD
jgi:hypothetical protein